MQIGQISLVHNKLSNSDKPYTLTGWKHNFQAAQSYNITVHIGLTLTV